MILLSGKTIKDEISQILHKDISASGEIPSLAIIQVGENEQSNLYIKQKIKFGELIGARVIHCHLPEEITEDDLIFEIRKFNNDKSIHGIIVQLPIPKHLNERKILDAILYEKDVDGLGSIQTGLLYVGKTKSMIPATTRGIISLLDYNKIEIAGKNVVVIGRSNLVGKPTAISFLNLNATVTICHSHTKDLKKITRLADILIVACGRPKFITREFVGDGQIIVDVGIHKTELGLCGDVDFEDVKDLVSAITPVPGGVGPMTVVSLFQNLWDAFCSQR